MLMQFVLVQIHNSCFFQGMHDIPASCLIANPPYIPAPDNNILMPALHGGVDGANLTRVSITTKCTTAHSCIAAAPHTAGSSPWQSVVQYCTFLSGLCTVLHSIVHFILESHFFVVSSPRPWSTKILACDVHSLMLSDLQFSRVVAAAGFDDTWL